MHLPLCVTLSNSLIDFHLLGKCDTSHLSCKKPRKYNNKKWYWCCPETGGKCNGVWRTHKPEDCRGAMHKPNQSKKRTNGENTKDNRALKLAKALTATVSADNVDSDGE